jgi:hypothetical protein
MVSDIEFERLQESLVSAPETFGCVDLLSGELAGHIFITRHKTRTSIVLSG